MRETTNYGLQQPEYTDPIDIEVLNENSDIIDAALKANADAIEAVEPPVIEPIPNIVIERLFQ